MKPPQNSRIKKFSSPRVWPSKTYNLQSSSSLKPNASTRIDNYHISPAAKKTAFLQAKIDAERNK